MVGCFRPRVAGVAGTSSVAVQIVRRRFRARRVTKREHLHGEIHRLRQERDDERRRRMTADESVSILREQRNRAYEDVRRLRDEISVLRGGK